MLRELHIRDFAIIDELNLTLEPGFNILTGETGAGKSILIDAVLLLLGGRADATAIREGAPRSLVEGLFVLDVNEQNPLVARLEEEGLEGESPDSVWLSREIRTGGRTIARVNGSVVSLGTLREIAELLIDIHGQSEHLSLLRVREHLQLLDRFAGLDEPRAALTETVRQVSAIRRELADLRQNEQARMQRLDMLRFQVEEIRSAGLKPGEKAELEEERLHLANAEQLSTLATGILSLLEEGAEGSPAVVDQLGQAQREMHTLVRIDAGLEPQSQALEEVGYQLEDLVRTLRTYIAGIEFNPQRLGQVEERLALLRRLERKYGGEVEQVVSYGQTAAEELERLEHSDERIAELEVAEAQLVAQVAEQAMALSVQRQAAAQRLAEGMESELSDLRMQGARFGVSFAREEGPGGAPLAAAEPAVKWITSAGREIQDETPVNPAIFDTTGIDRVEFLLAANVGEGLRPLARVASGGETARLMLALKTVLSRADRTPTLIFDEIDQGIGGRVGVVVGAKLWRLSAPGDNGHPRHQVLCITHLPQLAGFGDAHYQVRKGVQEGRTVTRVVRLSEESQLTELGQMLGTQGEAAQQGAREILAQAAAIKSGRE